MEIRELVEKGKWKVEDDDRIGPKFATDAAVTESTNKYIDNRLARALQVHAVLRREGAHPPDNAWLGETKSTCTLRLYNRDTCVCFQAHTYFARCRYKALHVPLYVLPHFPLFTPAGTLVT